MPWATTSVTEQRIKFVIRASQGSVNMSALCHEFGISRPTGYLWLDRYREAGCISGVFEHSRRPHHSPSRTPPHHEERIVALRQEFGWGAKKIRVLLLREGIDLKVATINRILKRKDLIHPKDSHRPALKRFERDRPNQLWQMDFKGEYYLREGCCYPLSILDDHSRFAVGLYALSNQRGKVVHRCLVETFETFGVPEAILTDHGIPWWSNSNGHGLTWLSISLIKQGIRLYFCGIRHPQTQGKVERFHRTLKDTVRHYGRPQTLAGFVEVLGRFRDEYNYIRPHEALQMALPAEHYQSSLKTYNPAPPDWEYPEGAIVKRLNIQGSLDYHRGRYFVCQALAGELVQLQPLDNKLLVSYRHMYIREINIETGRSITLLEDATKQ